MVNKITIPYQKSVKYSLPSTPKERLAVAHQALGTWKRPLKTSLRELTSIRSGLDRKIR